MKIALPILALFGSVLIGGSWSIAEAACPTHADLSNGIVFKGGLDGATLTVTPAPQDWIESLELNDDPDLSEYRFLDLEYPIGTRSFYQSALVLSYKGLIEKGFSRHIIAAAVDYRGNEKNLFPLVERERRTIEFEFRSPMFDATKSQVTGSRELMLDGETEILVGSCKYAVQILKSVDKTEIKSGQIEGVESIIDKSTVYYLPQLQSPFAIVHAPEGGEIWVQGMFDTVEVLPPSSDEGDR